jgi:Nif-specific regulatory protein
MAREQKLENVQMLAGKNLGLAEFEERQWDRSLELFRESRQAAEAAGLPPNFEAELFAALAGILSGAADLAKEKLAQAAKLASNRQQAIWIEYAEGMIMAQEGKEGLPIILEAIGRMREQGRFRDAALMALTAAESADIQDCGDPMALMSALLQAEAEFDRLGDREMRDRARQAVVSAARELAAAPGAAAGQGMLEAFYQLAFLLKSGAGPAQVGQAALEQAVKLTEAERGGLFIVSEDGRPELLSGVNLDQSTIRDAYEFSAKALGQAGREGAEVVSNDAQAEDDFRSRESVRRNAIRSLACIPLQFREGAGGALYLDSRLKPGIFSSGRRQFLRALASVVGAVLESSRLMESLRAGGEQASELDRIIGSSPPVLEMKLRIRKAAGARVNVLIEGETGTGKELAARAIHGLSDRRAKTFVALDCGSLPESLLEAELFGHIKGAFTGAHADKPGLFEAADGGTMFLDEITSASPAVQARLLRVIEEGEVRRVGDTKVRKVDVRLICAANKDMEFEIGEGRFKPDLYYRLNEFRIAIPPLRDRGNDVLILAEHFRIKHQKLQGKRGLAFSPGAKKAMAAHPWPGNIREMENAVQKAVIMAGQGTITEQDLELPAVSIQPQYESDRRKRGVTRKMLSKALKDCDYETSKAAQALGISQRQVQRLIKRFRMAT